MMAHPNMRPLMRWLLISSLVINPAYAETPSSINPASELEDAQAALSAGQYQRAYTLYQQAAKKNNPLAMFNIGLFYQNGWGIKQQPKKACQWFDKAAQHNIVTAQHLLAGCLLAGTHQTANPAKAASWYLKAAEAGHFISFCSLAELYISGLGIDKNPQKGLSYCQKAAQSGIPLAQLKMGLFLLEGDNSIRDIYQARAWLEHAANNHLAEASFYLGKLYRDHLQNKQQALLWFEKAASQGYAPAYYPTAVLYFNLPPLPKTGKPDARILAKSYLWLAAAQQRVSNPQHSHNIDEMLEQTLAIMPASWIADLDKKVSQHLSKYPTHP